MKIPAFCILLLLLFAISGSAQVKIPNSLARQVVNDDSDAKSELRTDYQGDITKFASEGLYAELVELNGDKIPEYIVKIRSGCGSGGCTFYIYRKDANSWHLLAHGFGYIDVKKTSTRNYRDIVVAQQAGAPDIKYHTLKFDGSRYQEVSCVRVIWVDNEGKRTKRVPCN